MRNWSLYRERWVVHPRLANRTEWTPRVFLIGVFVLHLVIVTCDAASGVG